MAAGRAGGHGGSARRRSARTGIAAAGRAALTLLVAGTALAQGPEPPDLQSFTKLADQLVGWAATPASAPAEWAPTKRVAIATWVADYATSRHAGHPPVAARSEAILRAVHVLLPHLDGFDRRRLLEFERAHVLRLKGDGRFAAAHAFLESVVLPAIGPDELVRIDFLLEAAEVARRSFRWPESEAWLDAANAAGRGQRDRGVADRRLERLPSRIAVGRGLLALERGLPDLAFGHAAAARDAAAATGDADDAWLATFLELRLAYATGRPANAMTALQQFTDAHAAAVPSHRLVALQIRAAMAVVQESTAEPATLERAIGWLRHAADTAEHTADERLLALQHLVLHALARGDLAAAATDLATAETLVTTTAELDERRLVLPSLRLRHTLLAEAAPATVRERAAALDVVWQQLLTRWSDEPLQRSGLGPLFLVNRQRAFVELVAAALHEAGAAGPEAALARWLATERHGSMARAVDAGEPSLATVRRALCRSGGVLVFASGPERGFVLAIDAETVLAVPLPTGTLAIERQGFDLLRTLAAAREPGADRTPLWRAGAALRETLLPPLVRERVQRWSTLAIVGADLVAGVPFELLPLADGRLLGATHEVAYLPSLATACWLATERTTTPTTTFTVDLLACPDVEPAEPTTSPVQRLPWTDDDAARFRDALGPGGALRLLTGDAATLARFGALEPRADLAVFLAHGIRDEARTDPQGILLGDGRVAWPADFERTRLPRHVVFASCRAGRGRLRRGDDGRHLLTGSALLAGARAVVVPWLDVGYADAKTLLAGLQHELTNGATFGSALRVARADLGGERGERSLEPFLFHMTGCADAQLVRPVSASPSRAPWAWILGAAALAVLVAVGVLRPMHARRGAGGA